MPWFALLGCTAAHALAPAAGVAWHPAATDAEVNDAFAQANAQGKPLLLYWGAKWCSPCNQLKAQLFNRQDFIEHSRAFVAVEIDGDSPGAQKLGARFKVRGYPTLVLFNAAGAEITRLPGEVDAAQVMALMQLGLSGGRPAKAVLADARAGKPLSGNEWRMLAFYSWDTDQDQLVSDAQRPALLAELAKRCPAQHEEASMRLLLRALAEADHGAAKAPKGGQRFSADKQQRERVFAMLADPDAARRQADLLSHASNELVTALGPAEAKSAARRASQAAFDAALLRLQADATLSRADRMAALSARVELARAGQDKEMLTPKLPAALQDEVRNQAAQADREITDGYERQAVITSAAYLLTRAGLWQESDALLRSNLEKSHSAYYLMSQLGGNARKLGRTDEALGWHRQAYEQSVGPATRLQWGAGYLSALVELTPQDAAGIERTASALIDEAAAQPHAFYERSARSLQRAGKRLGEWNTTTQRAAVLQRLRSQLDAVCTRLPAADPQRATCDALLGAAAPRAG
jgi:thiol-disulfide isomerase/thioredoxin